MPESPTLMPDLLTLAEAAAILGPVLRVSARTVRNWAATGQLASVRTPGGQYRIRRSDVDAFLAEQGDAA